MARSFDGSGTLIVGDRMVFFGVLVAVLYREEGRTIEFGEVPAALRSRVGTK